MPIAIKRRVSMLAQRISQAPRVLLVLLVLSASLALNQAAVAGVCANLPPSKLRVYDLKPDRLEEVAVPAGQLDQEIPTDALVSRHTMMLTMSNIVVWFDIQHRAIPADDGSFCDSPILVRMGLGLDKRRALLAQPAVDDECVRRHMLDHEAVHARAYAAALDQFIKGRGGDLQRGMAALKETSAPSPDLAKARWEEGLRMLLLEAKRQLMVDFGLANQHVDDAATLAALEDACGGKIRQLEQHGSRLRH